MALINTLERKFGRWGIPGLIRIVCGFMVLNYLLFTFNEAMVELLYLDVGKVLKGEVWRIFTFILVPPMLGVLGFVFFVYFQWFAGESLERAWGAFRFSLFYLGGVLGAIVFLFVLYGLLPPHYRGADFGTVQAYNAISTKLVMEMLVCAFACVFPEQEVRLMGLIPVKLKWIGLLAGGFALMLVFNDPLGSYFTGLAALLIFAGFFLVFVPHYVRHVKHRTTVAERRRVYRSGSRPETEALHTCSACGTTEFDQPDIDFRVSRGEEFCVPCLEEKRKAEEGGIG